MAERTGSLGPPILVLKKEDGRHVFEFEGVEFEQFPARVIYPSAVEDETYRAQSFNPDHKIYTLYSAENLRKHLHQGRKP